MARTDFSSGACRAAQPHISPSHEVASLPESAMVDDLALLVADASRSYVRLLRKEQQVCDMATD